MDFGVFYIFLKTKKQSWVQASTSGASFDVSPTFPKLRVKILETSKVAPDVNFNPGQVCCYILRHFKNTNPDKSYHLPNLGILSLTISRKALGHEVRQAAGSPLQGPDSPGDVPAGTASPGDVPAGTAQHTNWLEGQWLPQKGSS